jgi:hypothetical protein
MAFEGKLGITLSDKSRSTNFRIILSKSSYTSGGVTYTSTKYFMCPGTARKAVSFNVGFMNLNNSFNIGDSAMYADGFTFKAKGKDHTYKTGAPLTNALDSSLSNALDSTHWSGISQVGFSAGFNFRTIHNLFVDVDGWGGRSSVYFMDTYIDFLFSPAISVKNYTNLRTNLEYDVKPEKRRLMGWRIGWFVRQPKNQGFSQKFEIGQRPGVKGTKYIQNCYMLYTFGLYIPLKIGNNGAE